MSSIGRDTTLIDLDSITAKSEMENFPVALKLLPKKYRQQLMAFYNFARLVDDLGDEYEGDRLKALDWAEEQLDNPTHLIFVRRQEALGAIGHEPFLKLIQANRQDQKKHRYSNQEELNAYCELSANPVGHVVLNIFGVDLSVPDSDVIRDYSDSVCTGLQILEHLQDMAEDYEAGRIYLPQTEFEKFGVKEKDLTAGPVSPELRSLVLKNLSTVREMLAMGAPLVGSLKGFWAKLAVSGYVAGGKAAADALQDVGGDIFHPKVTKSKSSRQLLYILALLTSAYLTQLPGQKNNTGQKKR